MIKLSPKKYFSNILSSLESHKKRYDEAENLSMRGNKKEKEKALKIMLSSKEYMYNILNEKEVFSVICDRKPNQFEDFYVETDLPEYINVLKKHMETLADEVL